MRLKAIKGKILTAKRVYRSQGLLNTGILTLEKLKKRQQRVELANNGVNPTGKEITSMVSFKDAQLADWSRSIQSKSPTKAPTTPYSIAFVMSPPGKGSGGHQNLFRFIQYLEKSGHTSRIYLYSTFHFPSIKEIKNILDDSFPHVDAKISWIDDNGIAGTDALFATGWETAYPVFNCSSSAKRFYFVQDFEPLFYPMGSDYILAENTYKFGFYGITAGGWLSDKLKNEYGMETDSFDFGADTSRYRIVTKAEERKEIFFYARPVTARRGFEIGIMALDLFAKKHPEYIINLAGWDVSDYSLPFEYNNLGTVSLDDLNKIYNRCSAALVLSLTNMSLLPLELLASGTIPVVNEGKNNLLVSDNPYIEYSVSTPGALSNALCSVVERKDSTSYAEKAAKSVQGNNWDKSGSKFVSIVEREIQRG